MGLWAGALWGICVAHAVDAAALDAVVDATPGVVAVVVESGGRVVYDRQVSSGSTRGPRKQAEPSLHDIRSAGKSITALAVGAAIDDGSLASVDVAVWPLLGETAGGPHGDIRVRDLLTMSSSLDCDDWAGRRSPGFEERMYRRKRWRDFVLGLPIDSEHVRDETGLGRFSYCTAGVFLLGQVVEVATGETFDGYVQRRIFDSLGVGPVVWRRSRSGEVQSGGQLEIAAGDLARIGRLVLDRGAWRGEQILTEAWVSEMLHPWRQLGPNAWYGYLWWAGPSSGPHLTWYASGNGGNVVVLLHELDAVVVVQAANYNQPDARDASLGVVAAAARALGRGQ